MIANGAAAKSPGGVSGALRCQNVILIGYRGCGKSSVGQLVAARLGWAFVDTDERVEALAGRSISAIFEQDGEPAFRRLEAQIVAEAARGSRQVISVGGGAVLVAANRAALRNAGVCVWLAAPPAELHRRMLGDPCNATKRPALTERAGLDEIRHLLAQRESLYAGLAHHVVQTAGQAVEQVADAVLTILAEGRASAETP